MKVSLGCLFLAVVQCAFCPLDNPNLFEIIPSDTTHGALKLLNPSGSPNEVVMFVGYDRLSRERIPIVVPTEGLVLDLGQYDSSQEIVVAFSAGIMHYCPAVYVGTAVHEYRSYSAFGYGFMMHLDQAAFEWRTNDTWYARLRDQRSDYMATRTALSTSIHPGGDSFCPLETPDLYTITEDDQHHGVLTLLNPTGEDNVLYMYVGLNWMNHPKSMPNGFIVVPAHGRLDIDLRDHTCLQLDVQFFAYRVYPDGASLFERTGMVCPGFHSQREGLSFIDPMWETLIMQIYFSPLRALLSALHIS
jgi:hypothetical protein